MNNQKGISREELTEIVCRRHCSYYKEGREGLLCGTFRHLAGRYRADALRSVPEEIAPDFSEDSRILEEICRRCDFLVDGCDFRLGNPAPPCGGYLVVEWLRKHSR